MKSSDYDFHIYTRLAFHIYHRRLSLVAATAAGLNKRIGRRRRRFGRLAGHGAVGRAGRAAAHPGRLDADLATRGTRIGRPGYGICCLIISPPNRRRVHNNAINISIDHIRTRYKRATVLIFSGLLTNLKLPLGCSDAGPGSGDTESTISSLNKRLSSSCITDSRWITHVTIVAKLTPLAMDG